MTSPKQIEGANSNQKMEKVVLEILRLPDLQICREEVWRQEDGSQGTGLSINPSLYRMCHVSCHTPCFRFRGLVSRMRD
jgi:hypothetical protein